ncbi:MAG TPA: hypothetical protein EYP63_04045 [Desulfotomaculum sp.]|nr:hypothetical protein [Desulfotomaculum sp.]
MARHRLSRRRRTLSLSGNIRALDRLSRGRGFASPGSTSIHADSVYHGNLEAPGILKPVHIRDPGVRGERPHGRTGRGRAVLRQSLGPDGRQDRGLTASVKVPVLLDCLANIECRVVATYPAGDHVLFIGEVVGGSLLKPDADPLVIRDWEWGRYVKTEGKNPG